MTDWTTTELTWALIAIGVGALILGWLFGRASRPRISRKNYDALVGRERSLTAELDEARQRNTSLSADVQGLKLGQSQHERQLAAASQARKVDEHELVGVNASLREELEDARQRYADLHSRVGELDGLQGTTVAELDDARGQIADLEGSSAALRSDLEASMATSDHLQGDIGGLLSALRQADNRLGTARTEISDAIETYSRPEPADLDLRAASSATGSGVPSNRIVGTDEIAEGVVGDASIVGTDDISEVTDLRTADTVMAPVTAADAAVTVPPVGDSTGAISDTAAAVSDKAGSLTDAAGAKDRFGMAKGKIASARDKAGDVIDLGKSKLNDPS